MTKVGYEDIFDPNLFSQLAENIENIKKSLDDLERTFIDKAKNIVEATKNETKSLEDYVKSVNEAISYVKKAKQVSDERAKIAVKLVEIQNKLRLADQNYAKQIEEVTEGMDDLVQKYEVYKRALSEVIAEKRNEAKSLINLVEAEEALQKALENNFESYADLVDVLETLRGAYKDVVSSGVNPFAISVSDLEKIVVSLDRKVKLIDETVGQFQRNVGAYKEKIVESFVAIGGTVSEKLGASKNVVEAFTIALQAGIQSAILSAEKGANIFEKLSISIKSFARTTLIILALEAALKGLKIIGDNLVRTFGGFEEQMRRLEDFTNRQIRNQKELYAITSQIEDLRASRTVANLITENALLDEQYRKKQEGIELQREQILLEISSLRGQLGFLTSLEEEENIRKQILDLQKQLSDLDLQSADVYKEKANRQKEIKEELERISKAALDFYYANLKVSDSIDEIANQYKIEIRNLKESYKDLASQVQGDKFLAGIVFSAYANALENISKKYTESLREVAIQNEQFVVSILSSSNRVFADFIGNFFEMGMKYSDVLKKIQETNKALVLAQKAGNEQLVVQLKNALDLLNLAEEELRDTQGKISEGVKTYLDKLKDYYATFLSEEETIVRRVIQERERTVSEVSKTITDLDKTIRFLEDSRIFSNLLDDLKSLRSEFEKFAAEVEDLYEKRIIEAQIAAQNKILQKERDLSLKTAELVFERVKTFELESQFEEKVRTDNAKKREEIELASRRRLLEIELDYVNQQIAILREAGLREDEVRIEILKQKAISLREELVNINKKVVEDSAKSLLESTRKSLDAVFALYDALLKRTEERRLRSLELQQNFINNRAQLLIALAERGAVNTEQSLAVLEKQQLDIERQRQIIQQKAQKREAFIAALKTYISSLETTRNPVTALFETLKNISVIQAFVRSLPTFYEGTEYVSTKTHPKIINTSKDAFIARVHEGERIVPAHINKKLGNIKNEELPNYINNFGGEVKFDYDSLIDAIAVAIESKNKRKIIKRMI
ncbi:MAG: hypothetical protein NZZ41_06730 [Candidatus Dojkabacteria bacterium]|nr:hypothetical protein [Candidatus Dojkabacteria bacterium]